MANGVASEAVEAVAEARKQQGAGQGLEFKPKISLSKETVLPSRGLLYGTAMPGGRLSVRSMTLREEKILADPTIGRNQKVDRIIQACVENLPIPYDSLLVGDQVFLLFEVRNISYGSDYEVSLGCSACGQQFPHSVQIPGEVNVKVLCDDHTEPFYVELPVAGNTLGLRSLRVSDEREIERYSRLPAVAKLHAGDPSLTYRLSRHVIEVDGKTVAGQTGQLLVFLEQLPSRDVYAMLDCVDDNVCGPDIRMVLPCPACAAVINCTMPLNETFFRPKRTGASGHGV